MAKRLELVEIWQPVVESSILSIKYLLNHIWRLQLFSSALVLIGQSTILHRCLSWQINRPTHLCRRRTWTEGKLVRCNLRRIIVFLGDKYDFLLFWDRGHASLFVTLAPTRRSYVRLMGMSWRRLHPSPTNSTRYTCTLILTSPNSISTSRPEHTWL
jgi:hypothetical protein